jgi:hypothetical protein
LAKRLAQTLTRYGLKVWWDDRIALSERWDYAIEANLNAAKSVLVIWSRTSTASEWVNREATMALAQDKLVQMRTEEISLPDSFGLINAADVFRWERNTLPKGIRRIVNEVASRAGKGQPLNQFDHIEGLVISSNKVSKFIAEKKHREGYFPKLGDMMYADFWDMMMSNTIKLYDELRPGSRNSVTEERYYELVEYLSDDRE